MLLDECTVALGYNYLDFFFGQRHYLADFNKELSNILTSKLLRHDVLELLVDVMFEFGLLA